MAFHGQLFFGTGERRAAKAGPMNVVDGFAFRSHFQQLLQHTSPTPAGMLKQTTPSGHTEIPQGVATQQVATISPVTNQAVASTVGRARRRRAAAALSRWTETS